MPPDSLNPQAADRPVKPSATNSLHASYLEASVPRWLIDASAQRKAEFKRAGTALPGWYTRASPKQRKSLDVSFKNSFMAQTQLDKTMSSFKDIDAFARPLLLQALKSRFGVEVDVDKTLLCLKRPIRLGLVGEEVGTFEALTVPMLQAALHNFETEECEYGAFHHSSGFVKETATPGKYSAVPVNVSVRNFLGLCRELDMGAKYQTYLTSFFYPADAKTQVTLRRHFITSQKAAMRAAADQALLTKDIRLEDHAMILSVIHGERNPRVGNKQVWFQDLGLMRHRLTGCVVFKIADKYRPVDAVILYVPNDPEHPLKRYAGTQMRDTLKRLFSARDAQQANSPEPTAYQRFFSQFLPYEKHPYYFSQFVKSADSVTDWLSSPWRKILETTLDFLEIWSNAPKHPKMMPEPDPYVGVSLMPHVPGYPWAGNADLWAYLYEKHRDKVFGDARFRAISTRDVDAKARDAKLAALLQFGLLAANVGSMFIPVLGEVMMLVMTGQLLYETIEGVIEWNEGDKHAAREHLLDVAENLAQIAAMAAAQAGFNKLTTLVPEPVLENLHPVTLPNGEKRLWKPDLSGYESDITPPRSMGPSALGQYLIDGKTYFRQGEKFYEQVFDESHAQWRLKHPTEHNAYQPLLGHNGRGAWRLALERPMAWDRLTLLRRMGHVTDGFADEALLSLADVSGVSDDSLRKMHLDHAPPPPELRDAMRLFKADVGARQFIEQLRGAAPIDERYLYALPLVTDIPRWPYGRVLEVFDGPGLSGRSIQYGAEKLQPGIAARPIIQLSRAQVLNGEMPTRILAALEENEIIQLLGSRDAQFRPGRPDVFSQRLAQYAYERQSAIFDSLYRGLESVSARARGLQRECPGLSDAAAQDVLEYASANELARLDATGRSSLKMLEEARWHARQGRQTRAFAGLLSESLVTADSRRLALHAMEQLPDWPHNLRLEIRGGRTSGPLLDSIGEPTAPIKRYVVKNGPYYQAVDDVGQALNRVRRGEDSFYAAVLHALPEDVSLAIGLPDNISSRVLQNKIFESAHLHRREVPRLLESPGKWFKPPARVGKRLKGYYASGRGAGLNPSLAWRVEELYPDPRQAAAFINQHAHLGDTAIYTVLQTRRLEWEALNTILEQWQAAPSGSQAAQHRFQIAQTLRETWRNRPLARQTREAARLSLVCDEPLPALTTVFPHVQELSLVGSGITDANADAFLAHFPNVDNLSLGDLGSHFGRPPSGHQPLTTLPDTVSRLSGLTRLRFTTHAPLLAEDFGQRLGALTSLQELRIDYSGVDSTILHRLDLTPLTALRRLQIDAPHALTQWPAYVERLEQLERLDLTRSLISTLPDSLYNGQERLWAGLSLDWAQLTPAAFRRAYDYVRRYDGDLGHLVDLHQMVSEYCRAELEAMSAMPSFADPFPETFDAAWATPEAQFAAVEQLRAEHDAIFARFYAAPQQHGSRHVVARPPWASGRNATILRALKNSWHGAVRQRYGLPASVETFELPESGLSFAVQAGEQTITELAPLPVGSFSHVRTLRLGLLNVPVEQARSFIRAFSNTEFLDISVTAFTELPFAATDLPALRMLNASNNRLVVTPAVQTQINGLQHLTTLNLSNNPLNNLDVSALTGLQALNLRATTLRAWPAGAENLPRLSWLDLRENQIAALSPQALSHPDVLMRTNLTANAFSPEGEAALNAALQRIEQARGLEPGTLARFAGEPVPTYFPPVETGGSFSSLLLPLPEQGAVVHGEAGYVMRVQRLSPNMTAERAALKVRMMRDAGLSHEQIDARISEWHQAGQTLIRQLNGWLYTREVRMGRRRVNAQNRSLASLRIREAWLEGLTQNDSGQGLELSLQGLQIGDLPALLARFPRVTTLDLQGVGMTREGSNDFLNAFPDLERLIVSGNELTAVPSPVLQMSQLERLEMQYCGLDSATTVYPLLASERLRWLDLGYNHLRAFTPPGFGAMQTLDLRYNTLNEWPAGALEAPHLQTLNLSGNDITEIPDELFNGHHARLVAGTDLSENDNLSLASLQRLRYHARVSNSSYSLGISRGDIEGMIHAQIFGSDASDFSDSGNDSNSVAGGSIGSHDSHASVLPVEDIVDTAHEILPSSLQPWLADMTAELSERNRAIWTQLAHEENHERFFHLLRLLRQTQDFKQVRADLTRRVWWVMQAASEDTELRQLLFHNAETHGTCVDGRILTFSDLEVRVAVHYALRDIPLNRVMRRGQALVRLSRQLFRLDRVETVAEAAAQGLDRAEVRLRYRIGLTSGWGDGVDLPGQPAHMLFDTPISGELQAQTRASILEAERGDALLVSMATREFWLDYLQERHPVEMNTIKDTVSAQRQQRWDVLDERLARGEINTEQYDRELKELSQAMEHQRQQKLVELTRREIQDLQSLADETEPPGRLSPRPGPSWQP